jgi:hypothetical protein
MKISRAEAKTGLWEARLFKARLLEARLLKANVIFYSNFSA